MKKEQKIRLVIVGIAILCAIAFIWSNSIDSQAESSAKSSAVTELIKPLLELFVGKGHATEHLVRKLAHFAEFALLGALLAVWLLVRRVWTWRGVLWSLLLSFAVASVDETIQIFSGRGPMMGDVLLDFSGVCLSVGCVWLAVLIAEGVRGHD